MKKFIKIILVVLILVFVGITIYNISLLTIWGLDKSNPMTKEEVIELCNKEIENLNYMVTYENFEVANIQSNFVEGKLYVKNNVSSMILAGTPFEWKNLNTNERIAFWYGEPRAYIISLDKEDKKSVKITLNFDDLGFKGYEYLGETEINGRQTIVVKVFDDKALISLAEGIYFIDKQTGVLVKEESYYLNGPILKKYSSDVDYKYKIEFDCVTDKDIERPNLEGYTVITE